MNKIIFIILLLFTFNASSQTLSEPYRLFPKSNFKPPSDTIINPVFIGEIRYKISDATFYKSISLTGQKWSALVVTGGGVDSSIYSTKAYAQKVVDDSSLVLRALANSKGSPFSADILVNTVRVGLGAGAITSNTVVGKDALGNNTSGTANISIGWQSLYGNTTGYGNTAVGSQALQNGQTTFENVGIGKQALFVLASTGQNNVAIGNESQRTNAGGSYNTSIGGQSLRNDVGYVGNTAIGYYSLREQNANYNTAIGYYSGSAITSGQFNTMIGYNSGLGLTTGSANTIIGKYTVPYGPISNHIILTDGDGAARVYIDSTGKMKMSGYVQSGKTDILTVDENGNFLRGANASFSSKIRVIDDADFTVAFDDYTVLIKNNTTTGRTATIPAASSHTNRVLRIVNTGTQTVTSSQNISINPSTTFTAIATNTTVEIHSDGTDWWLIGIYTR